MLTTNLMFFLIKVFHKRTTIILDGTVGLYVRYIKVKWRGRVGRGPSNPLPQVSSNDYGTTSRRSCPRSVRERGLSKGYGSSIHPKAGLLLLSYHREHLSSQDVSNYDEVLRVWIRLLRREVFRPIEYSIEAVCLQVSLSI